MSHWPEFRHMATPKCKEVWDIQSLLEVDVLFLRKMWTVHVVGQQSAFATEFSSFCFPVILYKLLTLLLTWLPFVSYFFVFYYLNFFIVVLFISGMHSWFKVDRQNLAITPSRKRENILSLCRNWTKFTERTFFLNNYGLLWAVVTDKVIS